MTPHPLTVAAAGFAFGAAVTIAAVLVIDAVVRRARRVVR